MGSASHQLRFDIRFASNARGIWVIFMQTCCRMDHSSINSSLFFLLGSAGMAGLNLKLLTGLSMGPSLRGLPFIYYYLLIEILSMPQICFPVDIGSLLPKMASTSPSTGSGTLAENVHLSRILPWRMVFDQAAVTEEVINFPYPGTGTAEDPHIVSWIPNDPRDPMGFSTSPMCPNGL